MIHVRFVSLSGPPRTIREQDFPGEAAALDAVRTHAEAGGCTGVKTVQDEDWASVRYTATTPGGRPGRNVAYGQGYDENEGFPAGEELARS